MNTYYITTAFNVKLFPLDQAPTDKSTPVNEIPKTLYMYNNKIVHIHGKQI